MKNHLLLGFTALFILQACGQTAVTENHESVTEGNVKLNRDVLWKFGSCGTIRVNGITLSMRETVADWVKKLGPYDRFNRLWSDCYTWDNYGLIASCDTKRDTIEQMHIVFHFKTEINGKIIENLKDTVKLINDPYYNDPSYSFYRKEIFARPHPFFQGGVLLDGVVLGRGMSIKEVNALFRKSGKSIEFFQDNHMTHVWQYYPDCDFPLLFNIEVSEDYKDIEQLYVNAKSNLIFELRQKQKELNRTQIR